MTQRIMRPLLLAAGAVVLALAVAACSDDDGYGDGDDPQTATPAAATAVPGTPAATSAAKTPEATQAGDGTPASGQQVVGIVGAVNQAENRIEINRLSGADVTVVLVTPATRILSPEGRTLALASLRPSDRIIAAGEVEDGEMTADRVEIQPVRPGASPGG